MPKNSKRPQTINIEELVLFILNDCPPNIGVKKLNKLAFLLEWSYIFDTGKELTNAQFAAIDMGPVIDGYKGLFQAMEKEKLIQRNRFENDIHNYVPNRPPRINAELNYFLAKVLNKYKNLTGLDLEHFTHTLASYNITLEDNNNSSGKIIEKHLACLEEVLENEDLDGA
jgi:uncharacterized phage-associated protein